MILDGSKKSFKSALLDVELFGEISGMRLNSEKTEILWIGACAGRQDKLCPEKDLKWVTDKLKALGVWISSDPMVSMEANYNKKITKGQKLLKLLGIPPFKHFGQNRCIKKFNRLSACLYFITFANKTCRFRWD